MQFNGKSLKSLFQLKLFFSAAELILHSAVTSSAFCTIVSITAQMISSKVSQISAAVLWLWLSSRAVEVIMKTFLYFCKCNERGNCSILKVTRIELSSEFDLIEFFTLFFAIFFNINLFIFIILLVTKKNETRASTIRTCFGMNRMNTRTKNRTDLPLLFPHTSTVERLANLKWQIHPHAMQYSSHTNAIGILLDLCSAYAFV